MVLFILFALAFLATFGFSLYLSLNKVKGKDCKLEYKDLLKRLLYLGIGFVISSLGMFLSIYLWAKISPKVGEILATIFGSLLFGVTGYISLHSFILHYWGKEIPEKLDKGLFISLMIAFPLMFIFIFLLTNGFADYVNASEPLYYGFSFTKFSFVRAKGGTKPNITFYAICIISGALYTYAMCDHKMYQEYKEHGILESTFLLAFPAGIVGARLFYVLGQWNTEFKPAVESGDWMAPFRITDGGLTILGGALMGIIVGVLWFVLKKKKYNIFLTIDIVLPTILLAQGVGRWGNFFNCEVHGEAVNASLFWFLPKFIINNAQFSSVDVDLVGTGMIYAPLFIVEGAFNFFGYFLMSHLFGNRLRKYCELGDIACGYFIWYGLARGILEPFRHEAFIMDGFWSWFWSVGFIFAGFLLIFLNHLIRFIIRTSKGVYRVKENSLRNSIIGTSILGGVTLALLITGVVLLATSPSFALGVKLSQFNISLIILTLFLGFAINMFIPVSSLIMSILDKKNNKDEVVKEAE